jgi:pentatricopeptide repeat protein
MPRARVPNASFIASAELPFLPFLAPRVFTESGLSRRTNRKHGKNEGTQKEKVDSHYEKPKLRGKHVGLSLNAQCDRPLRQRTGNSAGGLLKTAQSRWTSSNSKFAPTSAERCYADISSFARQFVRSYRTTRTSPRGEAVNSNLADTLVAQRPSLLKQRGQQLAARRERALVVQRARLMNYVAYETDTTRPSLMKQGQYRSLRRRIMNLERWDETQVNLHRQTGGKRNRFVMTQALAALDRSLYPAIGQHTRKIKLKHDPMCARWSARVFPNAGKQNLEQTWENWMAMDVKTRQSAYERLLVYLLDRKPARAIQYIQVLASDQTLRDRKAEIIADALGHLAKLHSIGAYAARHEWSTDKRAVKRKFVSNFVHVFQQVLAARRKVCSQDLLYNLVNIAEAKDLKKVFGCLDEHRAYLGFDTVLHYANTFAKAGDVATALRCLEVLKATKTSATWQSVSDRERLRWTCALILRKSMSKIQEYHETPAVVAAIVRLGVRMDILLYNVVMHNAMDARDYATAFKVYNTLEENGLKADKHTYSILLHGCTTQDNLAMFTQFAQHCADVAEEIQDPWLATDYLYYLYLRYHNSSDKAQVSASLQQAYLRFFSARPLDMFRSRVRRTLSAPSGTGPISTDTARLDPPPMALYILYQAQIQEALTGSTQQILELYERFKYLVREGSDPALSRLANDPTIWNAFLLAFSQKQQFASASQLIKDMTEGSPQPNIYTWNIFMQAFFKTGQVQAAERVFEILRSRGVDPDQFTYGVLLRGYAKAQHVERIGEIMQHLDADQEMEPDLLRALAGITQRNKLMLTLEKSRLYKEVQAQEKAKVETEEETQRWTAPRLGFDTFEAVTPDAIDTEDFNDVPKSMTRAGAGAPVEATLASFDFGSISRSELEPAIPTESVHQPEAIVNDFQTFTSQDSEVEHVLITKPTPPTEPEPMSALESVVEADDAVEPKSAIKPEAAVISKRFVTQVSSAKPKRIARAKPIKPKAKKKQSTPLPRTKPENPLDPEVQYRKLQEKLGILAPASTSSDAQPASSEWHSSFGADLGYKSAASSQISKKLPEFTLRKMYQSNKQRGEE